MFVQKTTARKRTRKKPRKDQHYSCWNFEGHTKLSYDTRMFSDANIKRTTKLTKVYAQNCERKNFSYRLQASNRHQSLDLLKVLGLSLDEHFVSKYSSNSLQDEGYEPRSSKPYAWWTAFSRSVKSFLVRAKPGKVLNPPLNCARMNKNFPFR